MEVSHSLDTPPARLGFLRSARLHRDRYAACCFNGKCDSAPPSPILSENSSILRHYPGMAPPTQILVGGGISFVAFCWMLWNLNQEYSDQQPEDGHDRSERREIDWYWNPDRNKGVENIPLTAPWQATYSGQRLLIETAGRKQSADSAKPNTVSGSA